MNLISALATVVAFIFTGAVWARYRRRGGRHLLYWSIGALLFGVGTLAETVLSVSFHPAALKAWYLSGAMLTAAWLGQGTVALLVRRRGVTPALTWALVVVSLLAVGLLVAAPVMGTVGYDVSQPVSSQYREILGRSGAVVALTIVLNIYGTITLVGGALYSAYLFWRKQVLLNRMVGNLLIAGGALMPATAGSFLRAGLVDWHSLSELVGVALMFLGYVQAVRGK